jgi:hypothetical protein
MIEEIDGMRHGKSRKTKTKVVKSERERGNREVCFKEPFP